MHAGPVHDSKSYNLQAWVLILSCMLHYQHAPAIVSDATACMIIASSVAIANFGGHGLMMVYTEASCSCDRERAGTPYRLIMNLIAKE